MTRTAKPTLNKGPAAQYEAPGEIIREFSAPNGKGGLISIKQQDDGRVSVNVYRVDDGVEVCSTAKAKPAIHISGRRWFQRTYGNTYHSVRILIDGEQVAYLGPRYGYGDQFLQTALDWLKANGHAPADAEYGTRYLRETLGGTYEVQDVSRQKDL